MSETYLNKAGLDTLAAEIKEKFQKKISPTNTIPSDSVIDTNQTNKFVTAAEKAQITTNATDISTINGKIPSQASSTNQLADKEFVNSSISTATATFRGTYNLVSDLSLTTSATHSDIATALGTAISTADANDYCFVQIPTSTSTPTEISAIERYKYASGWSYEYTLNNSGFTAAQWAAINSGITAAKVNKIVENTTTIAGIDLQDNITKTELLSALNVADGAEVNVQPDWNQTNTSADDYIKNKPTIPTDTNQKIKTSSVTFGNDDVVEIVAGSNVSVTGNATNKTITISADGVTKITSDTVIATLADGVYLAKPNQMFYNTNTSYARVAPINYYCIFSIVTSNNIKYYSTYDPQGCTVYYGTAVNSSMSGTTRDIYLTDISNKVTKTSTANQIYGTNNASTPAQITLSYGTSATADNIVQRDNNGQVLVPETPSSNTDATSKSYVDTGLGNKQDTLTFDTTPTASSTNPATSGGIYTALAAKLDTDDYITQEYIETIFD